MVPRCDGLQVTTDCNALQRAWNPGCELFMVPGERIELS